MPLANTARVPVIAYDATYPDLDNNLMFLRTVASDVYQSQVIVDWIKLNGWKRVVVINSDSNYGRGGVRTLMSYVQTNQLDYQQLEIVRSRVNDPTYVPELVTQMTQLYNLDYNIFVLNVETPLHNLTWFAANRAGLWGTRVWLVTDYVATVNDMRSSLDPSLTAGVRGLVGIRPKNSGSNFADFVVAWRALDPTRYPEAGPGTTPSSYAASTYDATSLAIQGLAATLNQSIPVRQLNGSVNATLGLALSNLGMLDGGLDYYSTLTSLTLNGVSGKIDFDTDGVFLEANYEVINFQAANDNFVSIYTWTPAIGLTSTGVGVQWGTNVKTPVLDVNRDRPMRVSVRRNPPLTQYLVDIFTAAMDSTGQSYVLQYDDISEQDLLNAVGSGQFDAAVSNFDVIRLSTSTPRATFTSPFESNDYVIIMKTSPPSLNMWLWVFPFAWEMWVAILATIIIGGITIYIVEYGALRDDEALIPRHVPWYRKAWNSVHFVLSVISHSTKSWKARTYLGKLFLSVYSFVVLILMCSYIASLVVNLAIVREAQLPSTVAELISMGLKMGYVELPGAKQQLVNVGIPAALLVPIISSTDIASFLNNGQVDAVLHDRVAASLIVASSCGLEITGYGVVASRWAFAFKPGTSIVSQVSSSIIAQEASGKTASYLSVLVSNSATAQCTSANTRTAYALGDSQFLPLFPIIFCTPFILIVIRYLALCIQRRKQTREEDGGVEMDHK